MEINKLTDQPPPPLTLMTPRPKITYLMLFIIITLGLVSGFWLSRLSPLTFKSASTSSTNGNGIIPAEKLTSQEDLRVGKLYGNLSKNFSDAATGTIEKGSINGEGTHILNREGGASQRASLTSSVLDLDLFVGRKVEIKGETNISNKTGWLMDVGTIKILE